MKDRIIVALDVDELSRARRLIDTLTEARYFKVGLQAFLQFGEELISYLKSRGKGLFLDLKFKDIPNTVAGAIRSALKYGPDMLTIHLSGGGGMIRAARDAAREKEGLRILGVTVLTSFSRTELEETGISLTTEQAVLRLCRLGMECGMDSFVCSPREIVLLRKEFGRQITLVTPGIRPAWAARGDQKRVFPPARAIQAGADFLVIGRPIIAHPDPPRAFDDILGEIRAG